MTDPRRSTARSPYWGVPVARAIPLIVTALVITFSPNHSSQVGLLAYGVLAILTGLIVALLSWRTVEVKSTRVVFLVQGIVSVVIGALALGFNGGGLGFFLFCATMNSAIGGFLELYAGLKAGKNPAGRDWAVVGALTVVFALVLIFFPTDPVFAVGMLGAYCAVVGLFLVIGGLSLRWGTHAPVAATGPEPTRGTS